jgi:hypothetical protein
MRIDDVPDVLGLETELFELLVNCVPAREPVRAEGIAYSRSSITLPPFRDPPRRG